MTTIVVPFHGYSTGSTGKPWDFSKMARTRNLAISTQDEIGATIFALDAGRRTLLFAKKDAAKARCLVIELNSIDQCSIKKEYGEINAGALKHKDLFHFLKRIWIHLGFKNSERTVSLSLFDSRRDQPANAPYFEKKASKWVGIVSRLLTNQRTERI